MLTQDENQKNSEVNPTHFKGMKFSESHLVGWLKEIAGIPIKATLSFCMPGRVKYFIDIESNKGVPGKERLELILNRAEEFKSSFEPTEVILCRKVFPEYDGSFADMDDEKKNQLVFNFLQKRAQEAASQDTEGGDGMYHNFSFVKKITLNIKSFSCPHAPFWKAPNYGYNHKSGTQPNQFDYNRTRSIMRSRDGKAQPRRRVVGSGEWLASLPKKANGSQKRNQERPTLHRVEDLSTGRLPYLLLMTNISYIQR